LHQLLIRSPVLVSAVFASAGSAWRPPAFLLVRLPRKQARTGMLRIHDVTRAHGDHLRRSFLIANTGDPRYGSHGLKLVTQKIWVNYIAFLLSA
jgi:hypothetical protein